MKKRVDKVEKKFEEYNFKYANKTKEEMELSVKRLEDEIAKKNELLKETKDETTKEKLENTIKKMEQEKDNIAGYSKNKDKIEKIRAYKEKMNAKIEPLKVQKNILKEELKQHTQRNKDILEYIEKTLKDTKATEKMTNEQYNNLLEEKEKIANERKEIQNKIDNVQNKIDMLLRATSKCNLAWKSLFNDKSWDEIHVRAMNGRYSKKETTKQNEEVVEKNESEQVRTGKDEKTYTRIEKDENIQVNIEETMPAKTSKFRNRFPRLSKMFDFAKEGIKKVGGLFKKKQVEENDINTEQETEKEPEIEKNVKRDAFIEELRRHVENDKGDKEAEYIEKHKRRTKEIEQEDELEK